MTIRIMQGDCRNVLATFAESSADAIVTDPPYELTAGKKGGTGAGGFMGLAWDATGVAFDVRTWAQCLRVLKPGGHLLAFGGTRTYHRMVCAIEDVGFAIRDQLAWLYGSGFPKGTDKAKIPEGWRGWNTALKPALEPICLARKPMAGTLAENLARWGTGALWIDGGRIAIAHDDVTGAWGAGRSDGACFGPGRNNGGAAPEGRRPDLGRWPANVLHDGSDEVLAAFPSAPGQLAPVRPDSGPKTDMIFGHFAANNDAQPRNDGGSAARFFYCAKTSRFDRDDGLYGMPERDFGFSGAASRAAARGEHYDNGDGGMNRTTKRRNHHPTVKPTDLMRDLCRLVTPPGGTVLDPFMGSGSTLKAAELEGLSAIGIELNAEYIAIARRRIAGDAPLFADVSESAA